MTPLERERQFPEWYLESITKMGVSPDEALVWLDSLLEQGWKLDVCLHAQALGWWRRHTAEFFQQPRTVSRGRGWNSGEWLICPSEPSAAPMEPALTALSLVVVHADTDDLEHLDTDSTRLLSSATLGPTEFTEETLQKWQSFLTWLQERTLAQATSPLHSQPAADP